MSGKRNDPSRKKLSIPYQVSKPTRIFVYAAKSETSATSTADVKARRVAYANDDAVKIFGLTVNVDQKLDGIAAPTMPTTDVWHSIDGRSLSSRPTRRGIYIVGGKKVVIR